MRHIDIARQYLGLHEKKNRHILQNLIGFDPSHTAWCAGFVNAIEKLCGRQGTGKLTARSFLKYGEIVAEPQLGDIVIFRRGNHPWQGHVAYFVRMDGGNVIALGGNQGDSVSEAPYAVSRVLGYRRVV